MRESLHEEAATIADLREQSDSWREGWAAGFVPLRAAQSPLGITDDGVKYQLTEIATTGDRELNHLKANA